VFKTRPFTAVTRAAEFVVRERTKREARVETGRGSANARDVAALG